MVMVKKILLLLTVSAAFFLANVQATVNLEAVDCRSCIGEGAAPTVRWCIHEGFQACVDTEDVEEAELDEEGKVKLDNWGRVIKSSSIAAGFFFPVECDGEKLIDNCDDPKVTEPKQIQDLTKWGDCGACLKRGGTMRWCFLNAGEANRLRACVDSNEIGVIEELCNHRAKGFSAALTCERYKHPLIEITAYPPAEQGECGRCIAAIPANPNLVWCVTESFRRCVDISMPAREMLAIEMPATEGLLRDTPPTECLEPSNQKTRLTDCTDDTKTKYGLLSGEVVGKAGVLFNITTCAFCNYERATRSPGYVNAAWCVVDEPAFYACVTTSKDGAGKDYPAECHGEALIETCTNDSQTLGPQPKANQNLARWGDCGTCVIAAELEGNRDMKWCAVKEGQVDVFRECMDMSDTEDEIVKLCKSSKGSLYDTMCDATRSTTLYDATHGDCGRCIAAKRALRTLRWCTIEPTDRVKQLHGCIDEASVNPYTDNCKAHGEMLVECTSIASDDAKLMNYPLADLNDCGRCTRRRIANPNLVWCVNYTGPEKYEEKFEKENEEEESTDERRKLVDVGVSGHHRIRGMEMQKQRLGERMITSLHGSRDQSRRRRMKDEESDDFNACVDLRSKESTAVPCQLSVNQRPNCTVSDENTKNGRAPPEYTDCHACIAKNVDDTPTHQWCILTTPFSYRGCVSASDPPDPIKTGCMAKGLPRKLYAECSDIKDSEHKMAYPAEILGECGKCFARKAADDNLVWCVTTTFRNCVNKNKTTEEDCRDAKNHKADCSGLKDKLGTEPPETEMPKGKETKKPMPEDKEEGEEEEGEEEEGEEEDGEKEEGVKKEDVSTGEKIKSFSTGLTKLGIGVIAGVSALVFLLLVVALIYYCRRRSKRGESLE